MNHARFQALLAGQTGAAKKVYEAVPISEAWATSQIVTELRRLGSTSMEHHIARGCLRALSDGGLILEQPKGQYRRRPVRPAQIHPVLASDPVVTNAPIPLTPIDAIVMSIRPTSPEKTAAQKAATASAIDKLTALSGRAIDLGVELQKLARDIDTAALEIEEQVQNAGAAGAKLRQLQALLREAVAPEGSA